MTRARINDAMRKELRTEMLTNEKLVDYFANNPNDRQVLRHDQPLQQRKVQRHLKNVPDYLSWFLFVFFLMVYAKNWCNQFVCLRVKLILPDDCLS